MVKTYTIITSLLLALLLFVGAAGTADADFSFRGYTYNETNVALNNTNVSIEVYSFSGGPPTLVGTVYNSSNATGFFNISITTASGLDQPQYMYKPVIKHFANNATSGTLDWIGQTLPQFPRFMISSLTAENPMNFYLRKGGTININATNGTSNIAFKYMIKDTRLGYPITENFTTEQGNVTNLHVPLERNYSIMIFPNQSLPISYDLNNLSNYTNNTVNITFNTSIRPRWVAGYANLSDGSSNFTNLAIIAYLMEPGNIIGKDRPMPSNMSAFRGDGSSDTYNATNGSYNITLPGSAQGAGANILLFATAKNGSIYYGAFRNITMNYTGGNEQNFNFTLWELLGNVENISVKNMGIPGPDQSITTKQLPFQLKNGTENITNQFAHIEIEVNYSANSSAHFKWMIDVSQSNNGSYSIPAISANIGKINVFMQNFAPLKTSKNTTQLATQPVNITLTSFSNKKPDGSSIGGVFIDMLLSKPECDRPVPASGCSLAPDPTNGTAEASFNPFKIVLGGGKISLRIKQTSTRITVHYKNVDMLASGPPDALFDESANQSQSGTALEQAWRFGSKGPEIYDEVLIGVPISGANISKVYLGKLYDENWNATWNTSAGGTLDNLPSDYSAFNTTWFNSTTGMPCSTTDNSSACYIDTTNGTLWFRIPHFSGVGPTVVSSVVGNVTVNLTNSTGIAGRNVVMNFTVNDTVNATSFYNITFPSGFNAAGAVVNITINGTVDPANWNKTTGALFVNVSRNGTHAANANVIQYINLSNVTIPSTAQNYTINVTTNNSITVSLNYTVTTNVDSCGALNVAGTFTLTQNLTSATTCINITSSNVTLEGAGYTITNTSTTSTSNNIGVNVSAATTLTNVTVKNLKVTAWNIGIRYAGVQNGNITNNNASSNTLRGIELSTSSNINLSHNIANSNAVENGFWVNGASNNIFNNNTANSNGENGIDLTDSTGNTLTNNTLNLNLRGIYLANSTNNTITNNTARSNTQWDFYSINNATNNTVTNLTINSTTNLRITFTSKDVSINYSTAPSAGNPSGYNNISKYINATNNSVGSWLFLNVSYSDSDVASINENTLSMWKYNTSWYQVTGTNDVNAAQNYVYANITSFSIFAPMARTTATEYGSLNGTIRDARLSTPLASVTVSISNTTTGATSTSTTTDSSGNYHITSIVTNLTNPYNYTVTASKTNYTTNTTSVIVQNSSSNATLNISLTTQNGTLKGTYIKSGTSIAVSGATVNITNSTLGSIIRTTDTQGTYSVSLYPANYTINVTATGYQSSNTSATVAANNTTTVSVISLSSNTVTVVANRTVGTADQGQNVSFNLTVTNTGDNATFAVITSVTNLSTNVTNTTTPVPLLLNNTTPTGYVVVEVNNSYFGGWPVTITISNTSQSKSASVTLNAIMRNATLNYTNISSTVINANVTGATLVNATVQNGANVSGNSTLISNATITGSGTTITDGAVIKGTYGDSYVSNSSIGNATVVSSNLTSSTISTNATVTNSTLTSAVVSNSTLTNVTVTSTSTITNVANLTNITIRGVDVTGVAAYDYEGELQGSSSAGSVGYQGINFTRVYTVVRISQLVIEQSSNQPVTSGENSTINDTSLGTSMNFSMTVNLSRGMVINISETGISPDGAGFSSGTQLGNFLVVRSNDTNASNVTSHTLRLYFDTAPSTYSGGVAIYYYNTSTSAWEAQTTTASGTEGGRYYREAAPNHFSTFALLGTTTTTTTTTGGGSSGSTGGGGIVTSEPYTNIEMSERSDKSLIANTPVTYAFKVPELGVYEIAVTGKESENDIALRVEALKGTSKQVTVQAPGTVYKNINILAGTKRIKEVLIRFKVENSWLTGNNFAGGDVKLVKWDGSQWVHLETSEKTKDASFMYFEAKTDSLSSFAIAGLKGVTVPTATPAGVVTETPAKPTVTAATPAPTPAPTEKASGFELVLVVAALCSVYLFGRKRR